MKPIEYHLFNETKTDFKTKYLKYRLGRIKHELWLKNRKRSDKIIYKEDDIILKKCKEGKTVIYNSAGYYIKDLFPNSDIDVIESNPIVKTFYPNCLIYERKDIELIGKKYDNFITTNHRGDHWTTPEELTSYFLKYVKIMNIGCHFFYSIRDTQMLGFNRLKVNIEKFFLDWAYSLKDSVGLELQQYNIKFPKKLLRDDGTFDLNENPDTTNGNIKFMFVYKGKK